jgi:hypothetical protein
MRVTIANQEKDINELAEKVRIVEKAMNAIELRAAAVTGGIMGIVFLVKFLLGK